MLQASKKYNRQFLDDYIFRLGIQCPVKVQYLLEEYPVSERFLETLPFHSVSRRLLKNLIRLLKPQAKSLKGEPGDFATSSAITQDWIHQAKEGDVAFDPLIIVDNAYVAKALMIVKRSNYFELHHLESKAISPRTNQTAESLFRTGNWSKRLQKAAFNLYLFRREFSSQTFQSYVLFPNKRKPARLDGLSQILYSMNSANQLPSVELGDEGQFIDDFFIRYRLDEIIDSHHLGLPIKQENALEKAIERIYDLLHWRYVPNAPLGIGCKNCEYRLDHQEQMQESGFWNCWSAKLEHPDESMVFDLVGTSGKEYIEQGMIKQKDVPLPPNWENWLQDFSTTSNDISFEDRKNLQLAKAKGIRIPDEIMRPKMFEQIDQWRYPLYFLDFETITLSVANHSEGQPYHTYIPQFSMHVLEKDGQLNHFQWMAKELDVYTDIRMLEALADIMLKRPGTLMHFSPTEYVMMKGIRKRLKYLGGIPSEVRDRIYDLFEILKDAESRVDMKLFIEKYYYNQHMRGSLSLKSIYQAVCRQSGMPNRYQLLNEGHVRNGNDALNALFAYYCDLYITDEERMRLKTELMDYCAIDTLSMIDMLQYFSSKKSSLNLYS